MIFLDRSIPKSVAEALKMVRGDVRWLEDDFAHDAPDEGWIPVVAAKGWIIVSRDKKIRTRLRQRDLIRRHGAACFIIQQKRDPTRWEYLKLLAATIDQMEALFGNTSRPFMYLIDANGRLRPFVL